MLPRRRDLDHLGLRNQDFVIRHYVRNKINILTDNKCLSIFDYRLLLVLPTCDLDLANVNALVSLYKMSAQEKKGGRVAFNVDEQPISRLRGREVGRVKR